MNKAYSLTKQFLIPNQVIINASNKKFGRLATYIAKLLSKNQNTKSLFSIYSTNIIIINLGKINLPKLKKKKLDYDLLEYSFKKTIKKMLSKNCKQRIKYLNCYKTLLDNTQIFNNNRISFN